MTDTHDTQAQPEIQGFDDAPRKVPRWVKYLGGTAVGLVIIAAGAGVVISGAIDQAKYKSIIVEKVQSQTGYKVDWSGDIGVALLPMPHATIQGLTVTANDQTLLKVKSADVSVELLPLLSKKVVIDAVTVDNPEITLVTTKAGEKLWEPKASDKAEAAAEEKSSEASDTNDAPVDVSFNVIEVNDGVVVWDDRTNGGIQKIEDFDLRVKAQSLKGPFEINGGLEWNGQKIDAKVNAADLDFEKGLFPVKVKLALPEANIQGDFSGVITTGEKFEVEGDVELEAESLKNTLKALSDTASIPDDLAGKLELSSKIKVNPETISMNDIKLGLSSLAFGGDVSVSGFANESASPTISAKLASTKKVDQNAAPMLRLLDDLDMDVKGSMKGNVVQIDRSILKLNDNDISANGSVTLGETPKVDMSVAINKFDVDQLSGNLADAGVASDKKSDDAASVDSGSSYGFDVPFSGRIRADVKKLRSGGKDYTNIKADVAAINGSLQINKFEAGLPDGIAVKADGTIDKTKTMSGLDMNVSAEIENVEQLAKTYNITLPELPQKIGSATIKADLIGDLNSLGFDASVGVWGLTASGKGTVNSPLVTPAINKLDFEIQHPNFLRAIQIVAPEFDSTAGFEGPLDLSGTASWNSASYKVSGLKGIMGKTTVEGGIEADTSGKPSVTGNLAFGSLVLPASSSGSVSASKISSQSSAASGKARWSREAIDMGWMKSFDADIAITAKSITQNLWTFTNAKLDFVLKDGTLDIEDMSAGLFGGDAKVSGQVRSGSGERDPLAIKGSLKASNVDARKLQSALSGAPSDTLYGTIKDVDIDVNATGLSPAALVQTLGGKGTITGENIVVKGVDAAQLGMAAKGSYKPLERAGTMFGSFGDGQTEFTTFDSAFDIQNGIVNLTKSIFDGPKATLSSVGNINVPLWTIDLKNTMTVKDTDIPPFDFTIKGPLDAPTKAGGSVIEDYLRSKVNKKVNKLIENQLGKFLGGGDQTQTGGQAAPAADATTGAGTTDGTATGTTTEAAPTTQKTNSKDAVKQEALKALGNFLGQ